MRREPVRHAAVALLVLVLGGVPAGSACTSSNEARTVAASAVAGRVLDVSGSVTVAGKQLARGDTIAPADTIDTGPDGSVTIELAHNLARWELGPNKHVRVNESLAWQQPKRTQPAAEVEQDTASAGRPAERMAVDTVVTARDDEASAERSGAPATPAVTTKATPAVKQKKPAGKPKKSGASGAGGGGGAGFGLAGGGAGGGGIGGGGIGGIDTIGKGGGTGTGTGYGAGAVGLGRSKGGGAAKARHGEAQVSGAMTPELVRRVVRVHSGRLRYCYEKRLTANPALEGRVVVKFVIDASGKVSSATDAGSVMPDTEVVSCVVRSFLGFKFPAPDGGGIVSVVYPITFAPAKP